MTAPRQFRWMDLWTCNWKHILRRVWNEVHRDDCQGAAAQLAFYFLLAFFPFVVFLAALATTIAGMPPAALEEATLGWLAEVMPQPALELVRTNVSSVLGVLAGDNLPLLALSVSLALWAAAGGMRAVMVTLNRAYDVPEGRPLWWRQLLALLLTVALGVSLSIAFPALSFSTRIGARIGAMFGAESAAVWRFGVRLVVVGLLVLGVETVYHFAPNARRPWRWLTPGSLLAVFLWIPATALFALYVGRFARYETLYAGLGAPVVLLIWFYLTGFAILLGGELNAEIEKEIGILPRIAVPAPAGADAAGYAPLRNDAAPDQRLRPAAGAPTVSRPARHGGSRRRRGNPS